MSGSLRRFGQDDLLMIWLLMIWRESVGLVQAQAGFSKRLGRQVEEAR